MQQERERHREYEREQERLKRRVRELLQERKAILLAHNYQRDEIQEIADIAGDSLGLSQAAAETDARVIVFCGVHFMAESAAILCPDKTVLLPRLEAGCPMADMITAEALEEKKKEHPEAIVVCYVNSSAAVKAHSDICCTSANAIKVVNSLPEGRPVLFVPDMNLGKYVARHTEREILLWKGFCPTHHRLKAERIREVKQAHPQAEFVAHPECTPDVLALADYICSTSGMYQYAQTTRAREIIVGTELGILYRLRKENPEKVFHEPWEDMLCPNMKLTTLEDVVYALEKMVHVITVPEETRLRAKQALDRMLEIPRDY
ncbi:MAG: quinolinate synthase NadA [Candidatus Tectomicrobia bacterium]|uniref:Quinolinate synthase n=1 Tax=Tectimicrobiota bacterium TaxID=2528274 RepID=A0A932CRI1_UNCTE|nr:quinolinate synthase NadA [Candidatus Tectomicrobia bacterium]